MYSFKAYLFIILLYFYYSLSLIFVAFEIKFINKFYLEILHVLMRNGYKF